MRAQALALHVGDTTEGSWLNTKSATLRATPVVVDEVIGVCTELLGSWMLVKSVKGRLGALFITITAATG
jgi:hypothetical protein